MFEDVADDAMLSCEEVFGPVTSLYRFGALDEAIERANAVEFGLSAALFTTSLPATQQFVDSIEAGILHVNSQTAGADVHVPFGGVKGSGFGPHEQGRAAREFYTEVVTVYQDVRASRTSTRLGRERSLPRRPSALTAVMTNWPRATPPSMPPLTLRCRDARSRAAPRARSRAVAPVGGARPRSRGRARAGTARPSRS